MCFNATSSSIAAGVLIPAGIYTLATARHGDGRFIVPAAFPALFGIRQTLEAVLWLLIAGETAGAPQGMALGSTLGFLFFAYLVWPGPVPPTTWRIEDDRWPRRLLGVTAAPGGFVGSSLFVPLLLHADWLQVELVRGSILYHTRLIYDPDIPPDVGGSSMRWSSYSR